jgi:ligand-binding SRPBCC domain-containing protein
MTQVQTEVDINAPVDRVFQYYTDPDKIKEAWPQDVVKESEATTGTKNEPGSEMRVAGQQMGIWQEMRLQVAEKEENRRLVTRQVDGPFKKWESIQEFEGDSNRTHVRHTIDYEMPTTGKVADFFSGGKADDKIRQGLEQAVQTVKGKLEGTTS